jgi:NTE family protein
MSCRRRAHIKVIGNEQRSFILGTELESYFGRLLDLNCTGTAGSRPNAAKKINLALQGGGAHGAFTWGVLDHLLEDGRLEISGISGASAGAINAVIVTDGLARGGRNEARRHLAEFWRAASAGGNLPPVQRAATDRLFTLFPFAIRWLGAVSHLFSPYELNPLDINPLNDLITRFVDFDAVRASELSLFISTTNVHTGRLKIFPREKITADVVMASATLPSLFQAVEIDGVPHWDGGYMGNPAIFPFLHATDAEDVLVVQLNPIERATTPRGAPEIISRLNEITFNSALISELRNIDFVNRMIDDGRLPRGVGKDHFRRLNVHRIDLGPLGTRLAGSSKMKTDYAFLELLHRAGRHAACKFLDRHFDEIGYHNTIDLANESSVEWA